MHKKYYAIIMCTYLAIPVSLFFPVLKVNEIRLGLSGGTTTSEHYMNILEYIYNDINIITGLLMITLSIVQIVASIVALVGLLKKEVKGMPIKISFVFSFSCAILAALQLYSGSYVLCIICAVSFVTIAFSSIRLMKIEEKSHQ